MHVAYDILGVVVILLTMIAFLTLMANAYVRIRNAEMSQAAKAVWTLILLWPYVGVCLVYLCIWRRRDPLNL